VRAITAAAVNGFLLRECARVSPATVGCYTYWLRSLLRYLAVCGLADPDGLLPCCRSRAGVRRRCHSPRPGSTSTGFSPHVIVTSQPAPAAGRSCCCSHGWDCAPSRSRDSSRPPIHSGQGPQTGGTVAGAHRQGPHIGATSCRRSRHLTTVGRGWSFVGPPSRASNRGPLPAAVEAPTGSPMSTRQ
jgi:hypothetical protein